MHIAPLITHVAASQTEALVANDSTLIVYGILAAKDTGGGGLVTILDKDGTTLFNIRMFGTWSQEISGPFRADNGLRVTTPANVTCTVFHSQAGM